MRCSYPLWEYLIKDFPKFNISPNILFIDPYFTDIMVGETTIVSSARIDGKDVIFEPCALPLPFKNCYFELISDACFRAIEMDGSELIFDSICFCEKSPGVYDICIFINNKGLEFYSSESIKGQLLVKYFEMILNRMRSKNVAVGVSFNNKLRSLDRKLKSKINKIIYIAPKKSIKKMISPNNQPIDWSHKWEVRGHWRKCSTIGKDRDGNYLIKGFTWVKDHVKGPENKDLIIKTRVFKTSIKNQGENYA